MQTLNFLLVRCSFSCCDGFNGASHCFPQALAQKAQSHADASAASAAERALGNGCLRYFDWSSVAVVASTGQPPQRSSARTVATQPLLMLLISTPIAIAAFC